MTLLTLFCTTLTVNSIKLTVTTTEDLDQGNSARCPAEEGIPCSYRAALTTVTQQQYPQHVEIILQAETYTITQHTLDPLKKTTGTPGSLSVSIVGQPSDEDVGEVSSGEPSKGTVLDGQGVWTLLTTQVNVNVNVSGIVFQNGAAPGNSRNRAQNGGAINNGGSMVIKKCKFQYNNASGEGGAVSSSGLLDLEEVDFMDNHAKDGGAIQSAGTTDKPMSLNMKSVNFTSNTADQTGGALLSSQGSATLAQVTFNNHSANASSSSSAAGTILNGQNTTMTLKDCAVNDSAAFSGGLVSNGVNATFIAYRTSFSHGRSIGNHGGAVKSDGKAEFHDCSFSENLAVRVAPNGLYAQGSTFALTGGSGSSALFINGTVNASLTGRTPLPSTGFSSEFYVANPGSVLNLTFINVSACHDSLFSLNDKVDNKVVIRGSSLCGDGTYKPGSTIDSKIEKMIAGCSDKQCGDRALCTAPDFAKAEGIGVQCTCPTPSDLDIVEGGSGDLPVGEMEGYPYGGGPDIPGSEGFAGCYEQWNPALSNLSATGCRITPAFSPAATAAPPFDFASYACCALQDATDPTLPVKPVITAVAGTRNHAEVVAPAAQSVTVSRAQPLAQLKVQLVSADNHTATQQVNVTWMPGDRHCAKGDILLCLNASGGSMKCTSKTYHPVDTFNLVTTCQMSEATPACGFTPASATGSENCSCEFDCRPNKAYACACPGTDGTAVCSADGLKLGSCDCNKPYAFYPPPPAAPPPAAHGGGLGKGALIGIGVGAGVVCSVVIAVGSVIFMRRRRRRLALAALEAGLLNAEGSATDEHGAVASGGAP